MNNSPFSATSFQCRSTFAMPVLSTEFIETRVFNEQNPGPGNFESFSTSKLVTIPVKDRKTVLEMKCCSFFGGGGCAQRRYNCGNRDIFICPRGGDSGCRHSNLIPTNFVSNRILTQ